MNRIRFLAESDFPTLKEVYKRLSQRVGGGYPLINSVVYTCSEETERLLHELWLLEAEKPKEILIKEATVKIVRKSLMCSSPHYCSNCQNQKVYPSYKFCPHCGIKIEWIEYKKLKVA